MKNFSRYWQLVRLTSSGHCKTETLTHVEVWMQQTFTSLMAAPNSSDKELQTQLIATWQSGQAEAELAQLSLRCFISHQIRIVCLKLARQFGEQSNLQAAELFSLILDDYGQVSGSYQPFTLKILETYDPDKSALTTWCDRLTKTHPDITRVLAEHGYLLVSAWSLLTNTEPEQLSRILGQFHLCSQSEIERALDLLTQYQRVYKRDRLLQRRASGKVGRCLPPTQKQLHEMKPDDEPDVVLGHLEDLAEQLRQYRLHVKQGNPKLFYPDNEDFRQSIDKPDYYPLNYEDDQDAFLDAYHKALVTCLADAIVKVLQVNIIRLKAKNPPRDKAYIRGLYLFHCRGMTMGKLAPKIGLKTQVQVNRLLNLKRLRDDVCHQLIPQLCSTVYQEALSRVTPDRLEVIEQTLKQTLTEEVDKMMANAAAEAQIPKGRTAKSLFAYQFCIVIQDFFLSREEGS